MVLVITKENKKSENHHVFYWYIRRIFLTLEKVAKVNGFKLNMKKTGKEAQERFRFTSIKYPFNLYDAIKITEERLAEEYINYISENRI